MSEVPLYNQAIVQCALMQKSARAACVLVDTRVHYMYIGFSIKTTSTRRRERHGDATETAVSDTWRVVSERERLRRRRE